MGFYGTAAATEEAFLKKFEQHFFPFELRSHFISRLVGSSMIVRLTVVLNRTFVDRTDVSTTCAVVIFRVKVSGITSVDGIKLWLLV